MNPILATFAAAGLIFANIWAQEKPLPDKYEQPLGTCYEELRYPYPTAFLNLFVEGQDFECALWTSNRPKTRTAERLSCCTARIFRVLIGRKP